MKGMLLEVQRKNLVTFRSGLEQRIADDLTNQKCKFKYEPLSVTYTITSKYTPDFVLDNGIVIEAKGFFRYKDQRKHRAVREAHPELDLRFVFSNINQRVQGSKLANARWCEKYNFKYAQESIPIEWIEHVKKKRN